MEARRIAVILTDIMLGFTVFLIGLDMLQFPFNVLWGAFNIWLWIIFPLIVSRKANV